MQRSEQALNPSGANHLNITTSGGRIFDDQAFTWLVRIFAFGTVVIGWSFSRMLGQDSEVWVFYGSGLECR